MSTRVLKVLLSELKKKQVDLCSTMGALLQMLHCHA